VVVRYFYFNILLKENNELKGAAIEVDIPGGATPLTPDQAVVLTSFLDENNNDIERLHRVLTNIANSATFKESKLVFSFL
jgi:hypothetical protein